MPFTANDLGARTQGNALEPIFMRGLVFVQLLLPLSSYGILLPPSSDDEEISASESNGVVSGS